MRWGWGDKYNKPKKEQIFPQTISWISSHFVLADPWWLGTQSLPQINRVAIDLLFSFSSSYTSELVTLP
jgi:hypothetical protein